MRTACECALRFRAYLPRMTRRSGVCVGRGGEWAQRPMLHVRKGVHPLRCDAHMPLLLHTRGPASARPRTRALSHPLTCKYVPAPRAMQAFCVYALDTAIAIGDTDPHWDGKLTGVFDLRSE